MKSDHLENADTSSAHQSLQILEAFFAIAGTEALFEDQTEKPYRQLRQKLAAALHTLLLKKRPFLEARHGFDWPYAQLAKYRDNFIDTVKEHPSLFIRTQALLFLALLPFPKQWAWFQRAQTECGDHPELTAFIDRERFNLDDKLSKNRQKSYRLTNFCQVLKRPRLPAEKGILRIFSMLHAFTDLDLLKALNQHYVLYIEPPWGVVYRNTWLRYFTQMKDPCIIGLGGAEDRRFIQNQSGMATTSLAHGDFTDTDTPVAISADKQFDIVFNGTFADIPRKRHRFLLELLKDPLLIDKSALIFGVGPKENAARFQAHVHKCGLEKRVVVKDNLTRSDVFDYLSRCRMAVHLALNENVCRCIYEFFRSDLPCVMTSATAGMDFRHFNDQTGMVVADDELPQAIRTVLDHPQRFSSRKWFLANSGSVISSRKLNRQFKAFFKELGYSWSEDIVLMDCVGANRYVSSADMRQFGSEIEYLHDLFTKRHPLPINLVR